MKKRLLALIALNLILFAPIFWWINSRQKSLSNSKPNQTLGELDKIVIRSNKEFCLQKSQRTGQWNVFWESNTWPANIEAIEEFYKKLPSTNPISRDKSDLENIFEVTLFDKKKPRSIKLKAEEIAQLYEVQHISTNYETLIPYFLTPKIFCHVGIDCRLLKIKAQNLEATFVKRNGKWFLETEGFALEIEMELVAKLFREIFSLHATDISSIPRAADQKLAIAIYGKASAEKVNFSLLNGNKILAENEFADIFFEIDEKAWNNISKAIDELLAFKIFHFSSCKDLNITLPESGERFNFHDLYHKDKWQFTYSKEGELKVKEVNRSKVYEILEFLQQFTAIKISPNHTVGDRIFTLSVTDSTNKQQNYNFIKHDGRLLIEPESTSAQIEINNSFVPALFHLIRSNIIESAELVL